MSIPAYPLQWPEGWPRSKNRKDAKFRTNGNIVSVFEGAKRVRAELESMLIKDDDIVISTNVALRLDGWPRSDQIEPSDRGAAVYWRNRRGETRCMAIDIYWRVADNLAAIAATLAAMRAIERHGGAEILDRAFTGFVALAGPKPWYEVLDVPQDATREAIEGAYRRKRSESHPDRGGSPDAFRAVQEAYQQGINRV